MNGCGDQIVSSIQEGVTLSEHENSSNSRKGPSTHDDKLRNLTLEVPGFGGYYFDEAGQLVVSLTDTKQRDQAPYWRGWREGNSQPSQKKSGNSQ